MTDRDLTPLPPDVADLLGAGADLPGPSAETERRLYGRIAASVGIAGGVAATGGTAAAAGKSTGGAAAIAATGGGSKLILLAVAVAGAVGIGATVLVLSGGDADPPPRSAPVVAPAVEPEPAPRPQVEPVPIEEPPAALPEPEPAPPPTRAEPPARPARPGDTLAAERKLLDRARALSAAGDHDGALRELAAHARRFARGRLAEERDASFIHALVRAGRLDEARARAARFQRRYPDSLYGRSIESVIDRDPVTE